MGVELNCTHPLASQAGINASMEEIKSLLILEEEHELVLKIPALVFMLIYLCLGIPGNVLVILVYALRFSSSTTKVFIRSLAIFDLISCVIGIPYEIVDLRYDIELDLPGLCKILRFVVTFCACGSTLILLSVAVDRFRRICQPFKRQMDVKQSKITVVCMIVLSAVISFPALILYGSRTDTYRGVSMVDCTIDDEWAKTIFAKGYQFILGMLWIFSIIVLCIMYGVIIYKIRQQEVRRVNLTSASRTMSKMSIAQSYDNIRVSNEGQASVPKKGNPFSRLFSRDVNPIYEEEDEAHKAPVSRLCDVTEGDDDVDQDGQITPENVAKIDVEKEPISESAEIQTDGDHKSEKDGIESRKNRSVSAPCFHNGFCLRDNDQQATENSEIGESNCNDYDRTRSLHVSSNKNVTMLSVSNSSNDFESNTAPYFDDNNSMQETGNQKSTISDKEEETIDENNFIYDRQKSLDHEQQSNINSPVISENSQTFGVLGKNKYVSDDKSLDRITSKSDQTNGSIVTLQDSQVLQEQRRKTSDRSLIVRQLSANSNSGMLQNGQRQRSKTDSTSSQGSGQRTRKISSSASRHRNHSVSSTRELKTSKIAVMMFHVTIGHILSYLPHLAIQFHRALGPVSMALFLCNPAYFAIHHVLLRSIYLNNAINPIIYSYNNQKFRQYCRQILTKPLTFCRRKTSHSDSANSMTMD